MQKDPLLGFLDDQGRLTGFPAKYKKKLLALQLLAEKLYPGRVYTESELNDLLDSWTTFHDPATLRRELYNNHFVDRKNDGSAYWLEPEQPDVTKML